MKLPETKFPEGTHPTFWDFYDYTRIILNSGRYELRIVTSEPDWIANDGEMVLYDDVINERKYLYMFISDAWYSVTFLSTVGGGTRLHHIGEWFGWGGSDTDAAVIPANCIVANGAAISRTTYSELFTIYGTTYGVGDGSTTFNVPDMRGRCIIGMDNMGGSSANRCTDAEAATRGGASGDQAGVASHRHTRKGGNRGNGAGSLPSDYYMTNAVGTTLYTGYTGSGTGNMQPYIAMPILIQA